jgi:uncharacterized Zn finger protein
MPESITEKAARYLAEGRVTVTLCTPRRIEAVVRGSTGVYRLSWLAGERWPTCDCPAYGRCCHSVALQLVTRKPE